jgi:hypothetical protein
MRWNRVLLQAEEALLDGELSMDPGQSLVRTGSPHEPAGSRCSPTLPGFP